MRYRLKWVRTAAATEAADSGVRLPSRTITSSHSSRNSSVQTQLKRKSSARVSSKSMMVNRPIELPATPTVRRAVAAEQVAILGDRSGKDGEVHSTVRVDRDDPHDVLRRLIADEQDRIRWGSLAPGAGLYGAADR